MTSTGNGPALRVGTWRKLEAELAAITPEHIAATEARLAKNSEDDDSEFHEVGIVEEGDVIRLLWTLRDVYTDRHNTNVNMLQQAEQEGRDDEAVRLKGELRRTKNAHKNLDQGIWSEVYDRFPDLIGKDCIGLRTNWAVGWMEPTEGPAGHIVFGAIPIPPELAAALAAKVGKSD